MTHETKSFENNQNYFEFDENMDNLSIKISMGKGEIALNEQFLPFPLFFKRLVLHTCIQMGIFGNDFKFCYLAN